MFGEDPRPWLLASDEAPAHWVTLTGLLARSDVDPDVRAAREAAVRSPMVDDLIAGLPLWGEDGTVSGHHSPAYLPNLLSFSRTSACAGDDDRVERALDDLCAHQYDDGRFTSFGRARGHPDPVSGSLPCDTHVITEVLIRYGRRAHPAVQRALGRIAADLRTTNRGRAWTCLPDPAVGFLACLVAYNVAPDGTVTPRSVYRGFGRFSFGQKRRPSPIATALLAAVVRRFSDLTDDVAGIDVTGLGSSKGGTGTPVPHVGETGGRWS